MTEAGDPAELLGAGARARASPYQGLSSYAEADASFFFGREDVVGEPLPAAG